MTRDAQTLVTQRPYGLVETWLINLYVPIFKPACFFDCYLEGSLREFVQTLGLEL